MRIVTSALTALTLAFAGPVAAPAAPVHAAMPACRGGTVVWYVTAKNVSYPRGDTRFGKGSGVYRCRPAVTGTPRAPSPETGQAGPVGGSTGTLHGGSVNGSMPAGGAVNTGGINGGTMTNGGTLTNGSPAVSPAPASTPGSR